MNVQGRYGGAVGRKGYMMEITCEILKSKTKQLFFSHANMLCYNILGQKPGWTQRSALAKAWSGVPVPGMQKTKGTMTFNCLLETSLFQSPAEFSARN